MTGPGDGGLPHTSPGLWDLHLAPSGQHPTPAEVEAAAPALAAYEPQPLRHLTMTPTQVLGLQADLRSGLELPTTRRYLGAWLRSNGVVEDPWNYTTVQGYDTAGAVFATAAAWGLERSPAYLVTADAVALIRRAAQDLPASYTLEEHVPPSPHGFLVYAVPYTARDRQGITLAHRAVSWVTGGANQIGGSPPPGATGGVQVAYWNHLDDGDFYATELVREYGRDDLVRRLGGPLQLSHTAPIPMGIPLDTWDAFAHAEANGWEAATWPIRAMLATWQLMRQPLTEVAPAPLAPNKTRRIQRRGIPAQVNTIGLRHRPRPTNAAQQGDGTSPDWSCRWVVRGHWRSAPVGMGRQERRWVYVHPFIKGPEGKPLRESPRVYRVQGDRAVPQ